VRGVTWGHMTAHTEGSRARVRKRDHTLSICDRVSTSPCSTLSGGEQQKPGLIDTKRREHRSWRDSYSQARAGPQRRTRNENRQDATNGATVLVD